MSGWKDSIRKRVNNKERLDSSKKRKKDDRAFLTDEERYAKLGSGGAFFDSMVSPSYEWDKLISPFALNVTDLQKPKVVPRLKHLCALKIAENQDLISSDLLRTANWSSWQHVWEIITSLERDTYVLFKIFADVFYNEPSFNTHPNIHEYSTIKKRVLLTSVLPKSSKHRVERLFGNVNLSKQLIPSLNALQFKNIVILELSNQLEYEDYFNLTLLSQLMSLKISKDHVIPEQVINGWCSAIKANKWTSLQILCIPEIKKESFVKLQNIAKHCRLIYLEIETMSEFDMSKEWEILENEQEWEYFNDKRLNRLPWGLKSHVILRKHSIPNHSMIPSTSTITLDFQVINETYKQTRSDLQSIEQFDHLWHIESQISFHQAILLKKKLQIQGRSNNITASSKISKKKLVKTSLKGFFDLR